MSINVDSKILLDEPVGGDMILVVMSVDGQFRRVLSQIRNQLCNRVAAPRVNQEPFDKIGGYPVEGTPADLPAHADLDNLFERSDFMLICADRAAWGFQEGSLRSSKCREAGKN